TSTDWSGAAGVTAAVIVGSGPAVAAELIPSPPATLNARASVLIVIDFLHPATQFAGKWRLNPPESHSGEILKIEVTLLRRSAEKGGSFDPPFPKLAQSLARAGGVTWHSAAVTLVGVARASAPAAVAVTIVTRGNVGRSGVISIRRPVRIRLVI